jgi:TonB-linked SusC/RagA family outer membrane protein
MKVKTKISGWIVLLLLTGGQAKAQVRGIVSDEASGEPLPGVNINRKGTQVFSVSDFNGYYEIMASENDTLVFSFIGLQTLEIVVGRNLDINVALYENQQVLNEVVVVGYGTQRRRELTGAVVSVAQSLLEHNTATSVDALLSGAVAGVNVTHSSGQPGASSSIRIRGGNSVNASNDPLYVIDGFIFFSEKNATQAGVANIDGSLNPLASINPADIESIEILKDVSAKAIYGSRGANGVILVTTKKGKRSNNNIRYQYTLNADQPAKKLALFNAPQWAEWAKRIPLTNGGKYLTNDYLAGIGEGTDWQDAVLKTGVSQTHELSFSGGDETTRYLLSGNYTDQEGIVIHSGFERYAGRLNLDKILHKNLSVGITASADRSTQNALSTLASNDFAGSSSPFKSGVTNSLVYALFMPPVLPIYSGKTYNYDNPFELTELHYYNQAANPVSDLENSIAQTVSTSLLANFQAKYNLPFLDGLTAKISAGTNINYITQNFFAPPYTALGINQDIQGRASVGNRRTDVTQLEYLLTYTKLLAKIHFLDVLAGNTYQKTYTNLVYSKVTHIDSFDNLAKTDAASERLLPPASRTDKGRLQSFIGRVNYTLLQRYNLTATFRADQSSRFPKEHEWGYFPSLGLSWNISEEPLFTALGKRDASLSSLKLRATYGVSGNQEIGFNDYAAYFNVGRYNGQAALEMTTINNPDLKWETTTEYNLGLDAGIWNNRLSATFDAYAKETSDLLMKTPPPLGSPTNTLQTVNLGSLTNKGFEVSLKLQLLEREHSSWGIAAHFARNINTLTDLGKYNNLTEGSNQEQILREGASVGSFYGYIYDGVVQSDEDVSTLPRVGGSLPKPGDVKLRDISGPNGLPDGKISPEYDRTIIGSIQADFTYSFSSTLAYRNWDVFVLLQGSEGNELYNKLRRHLSENNSSYNRSAELLDAWTETNPSKTVPRWNSVIEANFLYSRYVEDASYLRLKTLSIGYTFKQVSWTSPAFDVRLFAGAQNLLTLTAYKGYDPEIAQGIDTGAYPTARTFYAGASLLF